MLRRLVSPSAGFDASTRRPYSTTSVSRSRYCAFIKHAHEDPKKKAVLRAMTRPEITQQIRKWYWALSPKELERFAKLAKEQDTPYANFHRQHKHDPALGPLAQQYKLPKIGKLWKAHRTGRPQLMKVPEMGFDYADFAKRQQKKLSHLSPADRVKTTAKLWKEGGFAGKKCPLSYNEWIVKECRERPVPPLTTSRVEFARIMLARWNAYREPFTDKTVLASSEPVQGSSSSKPTPYFKQTVQSAHLPKTSSKTPFIAANELALRAKIGEKHWTDNGKHVSATYVADEPTTASAPHWAKQKQPVTSKPSAKAVTEHKQKSLPRSKSRSSSSVSGRKRISRHPSVKGPNSKQAKPLPRPKSSSKTPLPVMPLNELAVHSKVDGKHPPHHPKTSSETPLIAANELALRTKIGEKHWTDNGKHVSAAYVADEPTTASAPQLPDSAAKEFAKVHLPLVGSLQGDAQLLALGELWAKQKQPVTSKPSVQAETEHKQKSLPRSKSRSSSSVSGRKRISRHPSVKGPNSKQAKPLPRPESSSKTPIPVMPLNELAVHSKVDGKHHPKASSKTPFIAANELALRAKIYEKHWTDNGKYLSAMYGAEPTTASAPQLPDSGAEEFAKVHLPLVGSLQGDAQLLALGELWTKQL